MRLEGKIAVIVGAGQSPGEGMGNGRATTLRFAQEGARILTAVTIPSTHRLYTRKPTPPCGAFWRRPKANCEG